LNWKTEDWSEKLLVTHVVLNLKFIWKVYFSFYLFIKWLTLLILEKIVLISKFIFIIYFFFFVTRGEKKNLSYTGPKNKLSWQRLREPKKGNEMHVRLLSSPEQWEKGRSFHFRTSKGNSRIWFAWREEKGKEKKQKTLITS